MPLIRLTHKQLEGARRNGVRSRDPRTPEDEARSSMNALKHGRHAKRARVLCGENKNAFHDILQSVAERSMVLQFLAARESQLTFQRQTVLNQLRQLRRDSPLPSSHPQRVESEPVDSEIPAANEPGANPQPVVSAAPPFIAEPEKCPGTALPEAA